MTPSTDNKDKFNVIEGFRLVNPLEDRVARLEEEVRELRKELRKLHDSLDH